MRQKECLNYTHLFICSSSEVQNHFHKRQTKVEHLYKDQLFKIWFYVNLTHYLTTVLLIFDFSYFQLFEFLILIHYISGCFKREVFQN